MSGAQLAMHVGGDGCAVLRIKLASVQRHADYTVVCTISG